MLLVDPFVTTASPEESVRLHEVAVPGTQLQLSVDCSGGTIVAGDAVNVQSGVIVTVVLVDGSGKTITVTPGAPVFQ